MLACSIAQDENYQDSLGVVQSKMQEWDIYRVDLLPKEQTLIWNRHTESGNEADILKQNVIDGAWSYETCYALLWSLEPLVDREIENAAQPHSKFRFAGKKAI